MKDKKKKKQKSEEKQKKKKAALLTDEKAEKEGRKKKKQKQIQENKNPENEMPERAQDVWPTQEMEEAFTAMNQPEKSRSKAAGSKAKKSGKTAKAADVTEDEAALIFRALGDETRLQIVGMLEEHELCAADLLKSVSIVQSTLSHHMKILCDSGAVNCRREGRWSYYSINVEVMERAADYLKKYRKA